MENNEVKSLKRQRSILIVIGAVLTFVTLVSMVYAFVQQGIATENAWLAQKKAIEAQENADKANKQMIAAQKSADEAKRQMEIATLQIKRAEEACKKKNK